MPKFQTVFGVDFSGAKLAGRNCWVATATVLPGTARLSLRALEPLERLAGTAEREPALAALVRMILASHHALWGLDFPFGLPTELFPSASWRDQLSHVQQWGSDAREYGTHCVGKAKQLQREMHIRRTTDTQAKTPFDCYHYRIIYQTFHGMRDVLLPLSGDTGTAVLPFQYGKLARARRVVVEACPSSTLKRLSLPHRNYKQPGGGPLTARRRATRHIIWEGLSEYIDIPPALGRRAMRNGGGDALDAIIAAVGTQQGFAGADHAGIAAHHRAALEGWLYV